MATDAEDLTVDYEDGGMLVSKQLDKIILTKGAWSTIIYRYQDWDRKKEVYGPDKYTNTASVDIKNEMANISRNPNLIFPAPTRPGRSSALYRAGYRKKNQKNNYGLPCLPWQ